MNEQEAARADHETMMTYREDAVLLMRAVRTTLADLLRRVIEGETGALKEIAAKQAELETALRRVFDAEAKLHDWMERHGGGGAAGGGLDLEAARNEIGCRLHRLRSCGEAERVP